MEKKKILVCELSRHEGALVSLSGWVYNQRSSGPIGFLLLRDGTGICQCVLLARQSSEEVQRTFKNLKREQRVEVKGLVKARKGDFEVHVQDLQAPECEEAREYPIGKKEHGVDFLLRHRHLWLRSQKPWAILRVRHIVTHSIHQFFAKHGFIQTEAPVLTPTPCEGSSSLFSVNFFKEDQNVYLSQSGQLYMEAAAAAFGKVYCFNPVFRAEKSSTRRHLLEFWMAEPEMAFCSLDPCMEWAERLIVFIVQEVLKCCKKELSLLQVSPQSLQEITPPFPRLHYREAIELLKKQASLTLREGGDLGGEEETILSSEFKKPVFIHRYPLQSKAFYMKTDPEDPQSSLSFDLLAPQGYGEIIGGSEREDHLDILEQKIQAHRISKNSLQWYLDLRKYGSFPHSGFGLGVERVVSWLCGLSHVREALPFPRLYGRRFFENG